MIKVSCFIIWFVGFVMYGKIGDVIFLSEVRPVQHFTEAPARFSEGSLVSERFDPNLLTLHACKHFLMLQK